MRSPRLLIGWGREAADGSCGLPGLGAIKNLPLMRVTLAGRGAAGVLPFLYDAERRRSTGISGEVSLALRIDVILCQRKTYGTIPVALPVLISVSFVWRPFPLLRSLQCPPDGKQGLGSCFCAGAASRSCRSARRAACQCGRGIRCQESSFAGAVASCAIIGGGAWHRLAENAESEAGVTCLSLGLWQKRVVILRRGLTPRPVPSWSQPP